MEQVTGESAPVVARPTTAAYARSRGRGGRFNALMQFLLFSLFVGAAFLLFALPVLLPVLREHARLLEEERLLTEEVERLNARRLALDQLAKAMQTDARLNERLARSDLGYEREGEETVMLRPGPYVAKVSDSAPAETPRIAAVVPRSWPGWTQRLETWADSRGWLSPFLDPRLRGIWLLMSGGLLVAAFVLFAPRAARPSRA